MENSQPKRMYGHIGFNFVEAFDLCLMLLKILPFSREVCALLVRVDRMMGAAIGEVIGI